MNVPIGVIGVVRNSEHPDHRVRVDDDSKNTRGYLIFEWWKGSNGPNADNAFDSWVEDEATLEKWFMESGWDIDWVSAV